MNAARAQQLLETTRDAYDSAAEEFSASRARFWEELEYLLSYAEPGMNALDIGCGNGRLYPPLQERNVDYAGVDNSEGLLKKARALYPGANFVNGDATALPFPDHSFDIAYSFATLHHMPGKRSRQLFVKESARVLKEKGVLVLTVWNLWTPKYIFPLVLSFFACIFSGLDAKDLLLPLGKDGPASASQGFGEARRKRYLHAFTRHELRKLLEESGFAVENIRTVARKSGARNVVVVARLR